MLKTLQSLLWTLSLSSTQDTHKYPKREHRKLHPPYDSSAGKGKAPVQVFGWAEQWENSPLFHHPGNFQNSHVNDRVRRRNFQEKCWLALQGRLKTRYLLEHKYSHLTHEATDSYKFKYLTKITWPGNAEPQCRPSQRPEP